MLAFPFGWLTFDRPGVQRLLEDAKSGKINLILCKDLSRFGRYYIQVGHYIDFIFPSFNIRFIAVGDNVDTLDRNSSAMDMMPIMNLVNANYGQFQNVLYRYNHVKVIKKQANSKKLLASDCPQSPSAVTVRWAILKNAQAKRKFGIQKRIKMA